MPKRPLIGAIAPTRLPGPSQQAMGAVVQFSPRQLFVAGEQGAWYDPSDQTTLFSTHDSTTPGVAVGNPVGKILDKSGRGNHATQSTLAARPVLQVDENGLPYLLFDGIDDCLFTSSINFASTDKMTVWAGVRKVTDSQLGIIIELSTTVASNNGSFNLYNPASPQYAAAVNGSTLLFGTTLGTISAPLTNVLTEILDLSKASREDECILRVNAVQRILTNWNTTSAGTGNFGNYPLFIGRRNNSTFSFSGRIYSIIVRGVQSTGLQIARTENWVNYRTGAY